MPLTSDISATYRGPGRVVGRLLEMDQREDRALAFLMVGCVLVFIAQLPHLVREAHLTDQPLDMMIGGVLFAWVIVAPLLLYGLAALSHLVAKAVGGKGTWFGARVALFWALLASSPLMLLHGLMAGFVGPGVGLQVVGFICLCAFMWFWIAGLRTAERTPA